MVWPKFDIGQYWLRFGEAGTQIHSIGGSLHWGILESNWQYIYQSYKSDFFDSAILWLYLQKYTQIGVQGRSL